MNKIEEVQLKNCELTSLSHNYKPDTVKATQLES